MNPNACADCLDYLPRYARRFVVTTAALTAGEESAVHEKIVCDDCAGWYGDDAIEVTPEEAGL